MGQKVSPFKVIATINIAIHIDGGHGNQFIFDPNFRKQYHHHHHHHHHHQIACAVARSADLIRRECLRPLVACPHWFPKQAILLTKTGTKYPVSETSVDRPLQGPILCGWGLRSHHQFGSAKSAFDALVVFSMQPDGEFISVR